MAAPLTAPWADLIPCQRSSAVQAVFNTYELREAILSQLRFSDLIIAAAVSNTWHTTIATFKTALPGLKEWCTSPRSYNFSLKSGPWLFHHRLALGRLFFVRRPLGSGVIAFLPYGANASLRLMDGKDMAVTFTNQGCETWVAELKDLTLKKVYTEQILDTRRCDTPFYRYVDEFYGPKILFCMPPSLSDIQKQWRLENARMMTKYGIHGREWFW